MKDIQYSPDQEGVAGGGEEAQSADLNFDNPVDVMEEEQEQASSFEDTNTDESPEASDETTETEEVSEESEEQESSDETETETEESDTEESDTEDEADQEESDKPVLSMPKTEDDIESESWQDLGKRQGFDVSENTIEAYEQAQSEYIEYSIQQAIEEATEGMVSINDLDPTVQELVKWATLNENADVSAYMSQLNEYDTLLNMSDSDLVREQLKVLNYTDEQVERQIEDLEDQGKVDLQARQIRNTLEKAKEDFQQQLQDQVQEVQELREQQMIEQAEQELEAIDEALDKRQDFMGYAITNEHRNYVSQKFANGEYDQFRNDPDRFIDLVMFYEFGEDAVKDLQSKSFNKGKDKIVDRMANSPESITQGGESSRSTDQSRQERTGTFADWDSGMPSHMRTTG